MSGAENGAERAKKSDERSGAVSGSRKKRAERRAEMEVAERPEPSGSRAPRAVSGLNESAAPTAAKACCPLYSYSL